MLQPSSPLATHAQSAADRRRLVFGTALLLGLGAVLSLGALTAMAALTPTLIVAHCFMLLAVGGALILLRRKAITGASLLLTGTLFCGLTIARLPGLDTGYIDPSSYILPILLAGLLLQREAVLWGGALSLLAMTIVARLHGESWANSTTPGLLVVVIATGLSWLLIRTLERALAGIQRQTAAALASHEALTAQQGALGAANHELTTANAQLSTLLALVQDLETPVIPLLDGVLVLPLVGHIDTRRAEHLSASVLAAVQGQRARVVIIDITGVSVVDTAVAQRLSQLARGAQLLGARVLLSGIRPEVAQTIVMQGIDLRGIQTTGRLQDAVLATMSVDLNAARWS